MRAITARVYRPVGIVLTAITLFGGLQSFITMSGWARFIVEHWQQITHVFWGWVFSWLGISVSQDMALVLTFLVMLFGFWLSDFIAGLKYFHNKRDFNVKNFSLYLFDNACLYGVIVFLASLVSDLPFQIALLFYSYVALHAMYLYFWLNVGIYGGIKPFIEQTYFRTRGAAATAQYIWGAIGALVLMNWISLQNISLTPPQSF